MKKILTKTEQETCVFAKTLAMTLKGGEIFALQGDLGAGKTMFAKGLAAGLGVKRIVSSPTFVIMKIYTDLELESLDSMDIKYFVHIDAYRLNSPDDILAIGADEYFGRKDSVVVIEWPERIKKILPEKTRWFQFLIENEERTIVY